MSKIVQYITTKKETEGLSCPFCGNTYLYVKDKNNEHFVCCQFCFAHGPEGRIPEEAILKWNKRVYSGEENTNLEYKQLLTTIYDTISTSLTAYEMTNSPEDYYDNGYELYKDIVEVQEQLAKSIN